jgi:hypothetical protein
MGGMWRNGRNVGDEREMREREMRERNEREREREK